MEQESENSSTVEAMAFAAINQAKTLGRSAQESQRALAEQIGELNQLKDWAVRAVTDLQKRADAGILQLRQQTAASVEQLAAERVQLQNVGVKLEWAAAQAIREAVRTQVAQIGQETKFALVRPLEHLLEAGTQVRQAVKETKLLFSAIVFLAGLGLGLSLGYTSVVRTENRVGDRLDRLDQILSAPVPVVTDPPAPAHKGKGK